MLNTNNWFVEVSNGVRRCVPPKMIRYSELPEWQRAHQSSVQGLFSTIFRYASNDPYVGGVIGDFYLDLDCEENPEKAKREAIAVAKKLMKDWEIPEKTIAMAFSGKKGIAITVNYGVFNAEASINLPLIWKSLAKDLADTIGLKTIDFRIYERRRLFRLLNSRHEGSGLFKIPLTIEDIETLTIQEIKLLAAQPREILTQPDAQPAPKAVKIYETHADSITKWQSQRKKSFEKVDLDAMGDDPPCIKKRLESGANMGSRNAFLFQLATYYAHKGFGEEQITKIANEFANHCEQGTEPFPKAGEVKSIVNSALKGVEEGKYSVGCTSEALADLCDKDNCPFFQKQKPQEAKHSCGRDLEDRVFEQIENQQFLVYNKETREITKQKTIEGFEPISQLLCKPVNATEDYESEQALWEDVRKYLYDHIDIAEGYDTLTAWLLASWIPEKWHAVPYLFFYGPPASGKTWALEVLASIGFRPFMSASATLASIFRVIDQWHPTMFLDETEVYMKKDRDDVLNLLNAGYRKDFPAVRVEETDKGLVPRVFDVFGFKALAGTREFMQTLKSRCVILTMNKAIRKISTRIDPERAMSLRRKLLLYRFRKLSEKDSPEAPDVLTGRLKELFDPLIVVAPPSAKINIIAQAKKIEEERTEEEQASAEAIVFKAVLKIYRQTQEQKIAIEKIVQVANENHPLEEVLSSVAIGRTCSKLGFKRTLSNSRRAIFWNKDVAERLIRRYGQPDEKQGTDGLTLLTGVQRTIGEAGK